MKVDATRGDLARQEADALVNAANNHLWMGGGVAGALKRAGGPEIEAEAMAKGPIAVGEAVMTGAGGLAAKRVIHAAVMGQDLRTDAARIRRATRSSLELAERLGLRSIAFPALGTGVGGFPVAGCARIMMEEVRIFAPGAVRLQQVLFVLYDDAACRAFGAELDRAPRGG